MAQSRKTEGLFLSLLRGEGNKDKIEEEAKKFSDLDWQRLFNFVNANRLFPICYNRLENLGGPCGFLSKFKDLYVYNLKKNIILQQELIKIIGHLEGNGIAVIPLKGPALARYLYGDLALRHTSYDLDLLVPYGKIKDAEGLLENAGFIIKEEDNLFSRNIQLKYARQLHLDAKIEGLDSYLLDLHWDLRGFFQDTNLNSFWQEAKRINFGAYEALMPSDEDLLLYLSGCALFNLDFVKLKHICDLHMLICRQKIDWRRILEKVKKTNLGTCVYFALKLCRGFFHTDIPEETIRGLRPNFIKECFLKIWLNQENILYRREHIALSYSWRYFISSYLHAKNLLEALRICYRKVFLPMPEVMGFLNQPLTKRSYYLYFKRLLKPFSRFLYAKNSMPTSSVGNAGG